MFYHVAFETRKDGAIGAFYWNRGGLVFANDDSAARTIARERYVEAGLETAGVDVQSGVSNVTRNRRGETMAVVPICCRCGSDTSPDEMIVPETGDAHCMLCD